MLGVGRGRTREGGQSPSSGRRRASPARGRYSPNSARPPIARAPGGTAAIPDARAAYRRETRNLVAQPLALNHRDFVAHPLVGVEVERQPRVEALDDVAARPLDGPRAHATLQARGGAPRGSAGERGRDHAARARVASPLFPFSPRRRDRAIKRGEGRCDTRACPPSCACFPLRSCGPHDTQREEDARPNA